MESMMPSATAWLARPLLVQWVMCNPSTMGSRQASLMIWARCRGGNLLRAAHAGFVQQESFQAALLVATANSPDSGRVTLQAAGYGPDGFSGSHGQDDAGMLNL